MGSGRLYRSRSKFHRRSNGKVRENPDDYPLPYDGGDYVDGSFRLSTDDSDEMKAICNF